MDSLSQKEILLRLMDKVEEIDTKQTDHIARTSAVLEAILEQAKRTNGRVTSHDTKLDAIEKEQATLSVKVGAAVFLASTIVAGVINKFL